MQCCVIILVVGISINYVFIKNAAYTLKKGYKNWGTKIQAIVSLQQCGTDFQKLESAKIIEIGAVVHEIL